MNQVKRAFKVGKSKKGIGAMTVMGALLEDRKSQKAMKRWFFNTDQRNYTRNRMVWVCDDCGGFRRTPTKQAKSGSINPLKVLAYGFLAILLFGTVAAILNEPETSTSNNRSTTSIEDVQPTTESNSFRVVNVARDDVLNIRSSPSAQSPIIGSFSPNEQSVIVLERDPNSRWVKVQFDGRTGWSHGAYLEPN